MFKKAKNAHFLQNIHKYNILDSLSPFTYTVPSLNVELRKMSFTQSIFNTGDR